MSDQRPRETDHFVLIANEDLSTASWKQVSTRRRHPELRRQRRISAANLLRRTRDPSSSARLRMTVEWTLSSGELYLELEQSRQTTRRRSSDVSVLRAH